MRSTAVALVVVLAVSTAVTSLQAQPPARVSLESDLAGRQPTADVVANMRERISYWLDVMAKADSDQAVIKAREGLRDDYAYFDGRSAGYNFAEQMAALSLPLLKGGLENDPLRLLKETNIAMAVAQMPQVTITPALEAMVDCKTNAAVRYFAWQGFRDARTNILAQGRSPSELTYNKLQEAIADETSLPVMEVMFRMLELDSRQPEAVLGDFWQYAQTRSFEILKLTWPRWCELTRNTGGETLAVSRRALFALHRSADWIGVNPEPRKQMLQMIIDLTWAAATLHQEARSKGTESESSAMLLRDCEEALNFIEGATPRKTYIDRVLRDGKSQPEAIMWGIDKDGNRLGVLAWVEDLKAAGVVKPQDASTPTTAPAAQE
ncbi:MAG: hypothetical protein GXY38_03935 [Planctomycetes bacterium]|nr:hypothetical protein [Planctomycetota bacterium]